MISVLKTKMILLFLQRLFPVDFSKRMPSVDLPAPAGAVYFNPMATPWEEWITQCEVALKGQVK
jgi:hypothetical protein